MTKSQARALGRMAKWQSAPKRFIMSYGDADQIIVVPPSSRDRRRWDIGPGGKIARKER